MLHAPIGSRAEALLYVAVHEGTPGDLEHYSRVCDGQSSVLELGCGDGRVLAGVMQRTSRRPRRIVGLERHPGMIALAVETLTGQAQIVSGDMARFELNDTFDRVLIPYSSFWCLRSDAKVTCLECIAKHLAQGGQLHFDVYDAEELCNEVDGGGAGPIVDELEPLTTVVVEDAEFDVFEQNRTWVAEQRLEAIFEYRAHSSGEVCSRQVIEHHYLSCRELTQLLSEAGFEPPAVLAERDGQLFAVTQLRS